MLVANSFDLWQKDTFFSAAEEVQQSADIMESAYRTWEREKKREEITFEDLDERCRELKTALGTAKWQLEEFEKAVGLSYKNRANDNTTLRHKQFLNAIENQILRVETALRESFSEQGKQPLRWVNLDEEECNDLAVFLSGTSQAGKDDCASLGASTNSSLQENHCIKEVFCSIEGAKGNKDVLAGNKDATYIIDIDAKEIPGTRDDINYQTDSTSNTRRTWSSTDIGSLKIVIAEDDNREIPNIEATPKDKGYKPVFWRQRCGDRHRANGGIFNWISQITGWVGGCQRQPQTPLQLQFNSVRFRLALMLTIFLIVPFVLYST